MNLADLERKLIAAARTAPPRQDVPYAFEKRIMALLPSLDAAKSDHSSWWSRALWRAAAPCVAIMLLLSAWTFLTPKPAPPVTDLSQELENTLLAAADQEQAADSLW